MANSDFQADFPNDRGKRFRLGTNRKVEMTLKQELDDVAKKSVAEILTQREVTKQEPLPPKASNIK